MKTSKSTIILLLFLSSIYSLKAQLKESIILETSIDQSIVMKHYLNAPNDKPEKWTTFEEHDKVFYKVYITDDTKQIILIYDSTGKELEKWELQTSIPSIVSDYLKLEFGKYKAKNYRKVIGEDGQTDCFAIDVNSKYRGYKRIKFYPSGEPYLNGMSQYVLNN